MRRYWLTLPVLALFGALWWLLQEQPVASEALFQSDLPNAVAAAAARETSPGILEAAQPTSGDAQQLASIHVTLIDSESGAAVPDVPVRIEPLRPDGATLSWMQSQGWGTPVGSALQPIFDWSARGPRTDERGACIVPWPAKVPFRLMAGDPEHDIGWVRHTGPALSVGELHRVRLQLPIGADFAFHGLVRNADSEEPIADAEVYTLLDKWSADPTLWLVPREARLESELLQLAGKSDSEGRFTLGGRSWKLRPLRESERVLVVADGLGPAIVRVTRANTTPGTARIIRLTAAAELSGHVTSTRGLGHVELRAMTSTISAGQSLPNGEQAAFSAAWDANGNYELGDLPSDVALDVSLRLDSGEVILPSPKPVEFTAGEHRVMDWTAN